MRVGVAATSPQERGHGRAVDAVDIDLERAMQKDEVVQTLISKSQEQAAAAQREAQREAQRSSNGGGRGGGQSSRTVVAVIDSRSATPRSGQHASEDLSNGAGLRRSHDASGQGPQAQWPFTGQSERVSQLLQRR